MRIKCVKTGLKTAKTNMCTTPTPCLKASTHSPPWMPWKWCGVGIASTMWDIAPTTSLATTQMMIVSAPTANERTVKMDKLEELHSKYGMPTIPDAVTAYYSLCTLIDAAKNVDYLHNFQLKRSDIVQYVHETHAILKVLKELKIRKDGDG